MKTKNRLSANAPRRPLTIEEQIESAQYEVHSARRALLEYSESAVVRLEQFAQRAREELTRARLDIDGRAGWGEFTATKLPSRILHEATWGVANASSDIETASSYAARYGAARVTLANLGAMTATEWAATQTPEQGPSPDVLALFVASSNPDTFAVASGWAQRYVEFALTIEEQNDAAAEAVSTKAGS